MRQLLLGLILASIPVWRPSEAATKEVFKEQVESREVVSVVGGKASLPCDLTPPFPSDEPHLILFYKDVYGTPIYSYDMRQKEKGRHWKDNRTLGNRAFFSFKETGMKSETGAMQIASFLTIEDLRAEDNGFYRCRVDFKEAPTKNTKINLKLIVPPTSPLIRSEHGKVLDKFSDPVREGSTLTLICETQGGEPLPRLTWKRGQSVLDDVVEEVDTQNRVVRNYLKLPSLKRQDHDDVLACLASNTNLSVPLITYININMVFPPIRAKIVREWSFFSAGQAYNVSCQVLGSRPPAVTAIYVGPSQLREVNYHVSPDGNVSTTTVIFIPDESDQGKFLSCRAENVQLSSSAVEDQWKLEVHYIPRISLTMTQTLDGDLIRKGDTVYLHCEVKANPAAHTVEWTRDEESPIKDSNVFITDNTLIIRGVHEGNDGEYQCIAKNQVGQGVSNTQIVTVKAFPSCANPERHTLVPLERHETTHLNCRYHHSTSSSGTKRLIKSGEKSSSSSSIGSITDPVLEFRWSMNSSSSSPNQKEEKITVVDFPKSQFTSQKDSSVLAFSAKTDMDFGTTITCLATDAVGQTSQPCTFQIVRKGELIAPRNCSAVNQTFESLSIVCMNSSLGGNQRYILEVFNSRSDDMIVNISTNTPVFHVQGLSSGTEYRVQIYSIQQGGRVSKHAAFETFTLQPAEKQLAATTTELASNNPMRLLPIVAVLIAIVLLLVILAVIFVIIIRGRNNCTNSNSASGSSLLASSTSHHENHPHPATASSYLSQKPNQETTSIDDYQHHQHHNSRADRISTSTSHTSVAASHHHHHHQYRQHQQDLNSPDLILPAAAAAAAAAAAVASTASAKGGYNQSHSINNFDEFNTYNTNTGASTAPPVGQGSGPGPISCLNPAMAVSGPSGSSGGGSMGRAKKSIMKKQTECQYAQLMFDPPSSTSNSRTFASDDSVLYVNPSPQHRRHNQTNYATIDHSRRHGKTASTNTTSRSSSGGRSQKGGTLMHSASCPFKGDSPASSSSSQASKKQHQPQPPHREQPPPTPATRNGGSSRSGTLKRVAFKDEQTVHEDDGASSSTRLIPSTATLSYEDPVPAPPPPGYESGFPITDEDLVKGSSENKCSTTEVESRL